MRRFAFVLFVALLLTPLSASAQGWESLGRIDGVKVWRKAVGDVGVLAFKGTVTADVHISKILGVFMDPNQRKYWVDRYDSHDTLERRPGYEAYRIRFALPFPISDRDYVLESHGGADDSTKTFTCRIKSFAHKKAPEDDCCVRAEVYGTYYLFEALPNGKTRLTVEVHTDPKGMLPNWVVNMLQKKWPSRTLNSLVGRARDPAVKAHAAYEGW